MALVVGAAFVVGSIVGEDDGTDTFGREEAATVKGLSSSEAGYTLELLMRSLRRAGRA